MPVTKQVIKSYHNLDNKPALKYYINNFIHYCRPLNILTFSTLLAISADDDLMVFLLLLLFPEDRICHFMQIVSEYIFSLTNKKKTF